MPDDDFGCPELWDEYEWERFLQQQDRKTEQYFTLFEKYANDPNRDEIIAREMGWNHGADDEDGGDAEAALHEWLAEGLIEFVDEDEDDADEADAGDDGDEAADDDALEADEDEFAEDEGGADDEDDEDDEEDEELAHLQSSEVYLQSMELNRRVFGLVEESDQLKDHPVAVELATRVAICGAKLAAALCGDDYSEVGMTIAYLKRSLKAATDSLNAVYRLREASLISDEDLSSLTELLFPIRERIVDMMGSYRTELRRRRGEI